MKVIREMTEAHICISSYRKCNDYILCSLVVQLTHGYELKIIVVQTGFYLK